MGTTCNEGPLHTTILRQIYLYWQWPFGTPEKIVGTWLHVIIGAMWIAKTWGETSAGSVLDCSIKVGGEYSFFYSAGPILPTELLCILLCRFWWVVVNLWVRGLDFCCLWSVSLVILWLTYSIHLGRSIVSTPGPWVGVTLGSAARYAYPVLDVSPVC